MTKVTSLRQPNKMKYKKGETIITLNNAGIITKIDKDVNIYEVNGAWVEEKAIAGMCYYDFFKHNLANRKHKKILAIDPGDVYSAYVIADSHTLIPLIHGKIDNNLLMSLIVHLIDSNYLTMCDYYAIEMIASYGMPVGETTFETCVWIGRFIDRMSTYGNDFTKIKRIEEKVTLCHSAKAKDANIRQALIDRFAQHDKKDGKGTLGNPDWFYGFAADVWQAYAVLVTYSDKYLNKVQGRYE